MTKAKKPAKPNRTPYRMVRLPEGLAVLLDNLAEKRFSTVTEQAKQAVREYLEKCGELKS